MKRLLAVFFALTLLLSGCEATPKRYSATYADVFDTVADFTAYCASEEEFEAISSAVHEELRRLHRIFDIYNGYEGLTNAKTLNDFAGKGEIEIPDELYELLTQAKDWYVRSGGNFNVAMGAVLSLWHDCRETETLPDADELSRRGMHCDISKLVLNDGKAALLDPEMSLDLGALAKGCAAEKAAELAESMGADRFALSVGGNIVTRGEKPSGNWEIGVADPDGGILFVVNVAGKCVVTSGDYQRYFEVDGVRYHHIIDPATLEPAAKWRSVTVICDNSAVADALSTSLFCMTQEDGSRLCADFGAEALWVATGGTLTRTEGFEYYED